MKFSIVIPTYNEEHDIRGTLDSLVALDYADKEILIVDDSTDSTPDIVREYAALGVRLIHPGGGGRCEARNLGIQQAAGEVVVILNADVRLPVDFLTRLKPHYEAGADYVLVNAHVSNSEALFARYVDAINNQYYAHPEHLEWTEGFSCRREKALDAGLFPVGFPVPICAGEDGFFGTNLRALGALKATDLSIVATHVSPASFEEYWAIRKGRGKGSAQVHRYLYGWSMPKIFLWNALKSFRLFLSVATVVPALTSALAIARHSPYGLRDWLPFTYAWFLEQLSFQVGDLESARQILDKERALKLAGRPWQGNTSP